MKQLDKETKLTIQVMLATLLIIVGVVLLFLGFYTEPPGQIHDSVLIAYGQVSTFAGALLGIDYSYKYKMFRDTLNHEKTNIVVPDKSAILTTLSTPLTFFILSSIIIQLLVFVNKISPKTGHPQIQAAE